MRKTDRMLDGHRGREGGREIKREQEQMPQARTDLS